MNKILHDKYHCKKSQQGLCGFTLAEVLITLGIIGVVAAITIPTLITNYNTESWKTASDVFNTKFMEALKAMNAQQKLAGHATTEAFVDELGKHFKISKVCNNENLKDCFSETVYWGGSTENPNKIDLATVKTAKNFGQNAWNTDVIGAQFANGTTA